MKRKRRILSLLLSGAMLFSLCTPTVFAETPTQDRGQSVTETGGLCEHHPEHNADCGYTEGTAGTPCVHEHTADCYEEVTNCVHEHDEDCYPEESVSGNEATPSGAQKREPENCPHICDEKSGCITKELNCQHEHDDECGYSPATAGTPCGYVCELCGAGNNTPSNAKAVTVASVQAMIDALPNAEEITENNAEEVKAKLDAIDEAKEKLSDEEIDELDMTRYAEAAAALGALAAPMLLADDSPDEQFSLKPGDTYYFDLSAMGIPGTANSGNSDGAAPLPDMSLHYVPFTYVGTINAYSRNSEGVSTDDTVKPYAHSLFIADYNVTHTVSWDDLNNEELIFGKGYVAGGVDYTLRAPSAGSGSYDSERGTPQSNEWDTILVKDNGYIQNWNKMYSWGQDTFSDYASFRAVRGYRSARRWDYDGAANSYPRVGFRPVLEVLNPDTLGSDGLEVVTLDLGGGKLGGSSEAIQIIVKTGSTFTAPASDGLTRPDGDTGSYFVWLGSDGKLYAPGDNVPADVIELTAQFTLSEQFSLTPGGRYYFDLSGEKIPGTANGNLPDSTLHYVPFTYVGTINAYSRNSEGVSTDDTVKPYAHSLFVADYAVTHAVSWNDLNTASLIFGKNYASGGVDYTLRAPSAGSNSTGSGDSDPGVPQSNEWDTILNKDDEYIQNWNKIILWGQDTFSGDASHRAVRGCDSARFWSYCYATGSPPIVGFRPVLEVLNPDTLGSDGLKVVTLDLGGGKLGNSSEDIQIIVKNGSTFTAPASDGMTRPDGDSGNYFMWLDGNGNSYKPGDSVPADVTKLTVQWTAPAYTVTLNTNGGTIADGKDVTGYTYGVGATLPTDVTRTGYTFKGWYDNENLTGSPVTAISNTETGNKEYWAKWTVNQYTITFDTAGGSEIAPITQDYGSTIAAPAAPTKTGYTFTGWSPALPATMPAGDLTVKAQWTAKQYTITFDTDGGSEVAPITQDYGTAITAPANPTRDGYTFTGWNPEIPATMPAGDLTVKAQWTANRYTITFDTDGGSEIVPIKQDYGTDITAPADPTREGYTFTGWDKAIPATMPAENVTITAQWTVNQYTVTLNTNGGTINSGNITSYTYGVGATLPTADDMTYAGHTFKGWYEDSSFSDSPVTEISTTATGAKTYYAKWLSTDAGITAVSVDNTAGTINGTTITVVLPYGTVALPTENSKVSITAADGATVSDLTTTDGSEWTFTVTAADGQTTKNYTISVSIAPDPATGNKSDIAAAKSTVENHDWTVPQATANTEEAVKTWIEGQLAAMNLNGASYTVTMTGFTAATEGTAADRDGTNGSFTFTVKLYKGNDTGNIATSTYAEATVTISNGTVTATPYTKWTVTVNAGNGGSVSGGGTFEENTQVTVTATPNSGYHFVRWTENGAEVSTSASYSFTLTADRTLTAVFSRNSSGGYSYYTIEATAGAGGSISPSGNVSVREGRDQTFTITPDKGYAVANVKIDGKSIGAVKSYTFENVRRTHTIEVIFMKANGNPQTGVFVDVATGSYYEDAVDWAVEKGITNGVSSNMFAPDDPCTRAQIVTFLWRAAGSPAPKSMSSFTDVPADAFYAKAVAWAVENGITSGTGEGKFSPNAICTRAQSVTFLYRASGSPAVSGSAEFSDVSTTAFYADAVAWATKKGITTGIGGGLFGADNDCTRSQIVTFLWRCKK